MSKIILDTDARGCVCKILQAGRESQSVLVQTDYESPSVASSFGWSIRSVQNETDRRYGVICDHQHTDGTIDCPACGIKASAFIAAAQEWIDENDGIEAEDPGYFQGDDQ